MRERPKKLAFEPVGLLKLGVGGAQFTHLAFEPLDELEVVLAQHRRLDRLRQRLALTVHEFFELIGQPARIDRLGDVAVAAGDERALARPGAAVGGDRDDRRAAQVPHAAQPGGRLVPVKPWDADIHQDQRWRGLAGQGDPIGAGFREQHAVTARLQDALDQPLVVGVVLDIENRRFVVHRTTLDQAFFSV